MASTSARVGVAAAVVGAGLATAYRAKVLADEQAAATREAAARQEALRAALQQMEGRARAGGAAGSSPELEAEAEACVAALNAETRAAFARLRKALKSLAAHRPRPLLQVPLLGTHEGVDVGMLAAFLLWGDSEAYSLLAAAPFLAAELGIPAPNDCLLDPVALTRFGATLASLSDDTVRAVQQWLQEVAALRALPEPAAGVPRARVHAAPAGGGAAYDAWYSTLLYFSSCGSQSDVPGGVRMLAQRMPAEEHVAADVVAIAKALGIGLLPYPACWMYIADTNEQPREEADGSQLVVVEVVPGGALQRGRYVMSEPQRRMSDLTPQAGDTVFLTSFIPARGVPFRIRAAVTKDQKSFRTILLAPT